MKIKSEELQQRLVAIGRKLSLEDRKDFMDVLDTLGRAYYEIGEVLKMAFIELLPSKTDAATPVVSTIQSSTSVPTFKPSDKLSDIAMALARNLENQMKEKK